MGKGIAHSQWLNIVIIIISALVLAFTLIGRIMDNAVDESDARQIVATDDSQQVNVPVMQLISVDFGNLRMTGKQQKIDSKLGLIWSTEPNGILSQKQIKTLLDSWQKILVMPTQPLNQSISINYSPIAIVLLYFTEVAQPIIAKVELSDKIESTPTIIIRFVSTGQQIIIDELSLEQILPLQVLQKSHGEKNPSNPTDSKGLN